MCVGPAKNACQLVNILDDTKLVLPTSSVVWKAGPCQLCSRTRLSIANLRAVFALAHIHLRQCMDTNPKHSIEKNIYLDTVLECCCSNQHVLYETNSSAVFTSFGFAAVDAISRRWDIKSSFRVCLWSPVYGPVLLQTHQMLPYARNHIWRTYMNKL